MCKKINYIYKCNINNCNKNSYFKYHINEICYSCTINSINNKRKIKMLLKDYKKYIVN